MFYKTAFERKLVLSLTIVAGLCLAIGLIGWLKINEISRQAAFNRQLTICSTLFGQVRRSEQETFNRASQLELSVHQASGDWKRARNRFLSELRKMSRNSSLDDRERQLIQSIEESWKGYEAAFNRYTIAADLERDPHQISAAAGEIIDRIETLSTLANASMTRTIRLAKVQLGLVTALAAVVGVLVCLMAGRQSTGDLHELDRQAQEIRNSLETLTALVGATGRTADSADDTPPDQRQESESEENDQVS